MLGEVLAVLAVVFACSALAGVACFMAVRRVRRSWGWRRARLMQQRVFSSPRCRRELARLRADVLRAMHGGRSIISLVDGRPGSHGELRSLQRRLELLAATVDRQLEALAYEPDERVLSATLPGMRRRVEQVVRAASEVRAGASLLLDDGTDLELEVFAHDVHQELEALKRGREVLARCGDYSVSAPGRSRRALLLDEPTAIAPTQSR